MRTGFFVDVGGSFTKGLIALPPIFFSLPDRCPPTPLFLAKGRKNFKMALFFKLSPPRGGGGEGCYPGPWVSESRPNPPSEFKRKPAWRAPTSPEDTLFLSLSSHRSSTTTRSSGSSASPLPTHSTGAPPPICERLAIDENEPSGDPASEILTSQKHPPILSPGGSSRNLSKRGFAPLPQFRNLSESAQRNAD